MFSGLLPIGSVVLLKESTKKVMIIGVCQRSANDENKVYDYASVLFPEGFLNPNQMFLFNHNQIERIHCIGYQDEEQLAFNERTTQAWAEMKVKSEEN